MNEGYSYLTDSFTLNKKGLDKMTNPFKLSKINCPKLLKSPYSPSQKLFSFFFLLWRKSPKGDRGWKGLG